MKTRTKRKKRERDVESSGKKAEEEGSSYLNSTLPIQDIMELANNGITMRRFFRIKPK